MRKIKYIDISMKIHEIIQKNYSKNKIKIIKIY